MVGVLTGILASVMKLVVEKCQIFYLPFISDLIDVREKKPFAKEKLKSFAIHFTKYVH